MISARCLDCEANKNPAAGSVPLDKGKCSICGSSSIIVPGAVKELEMLQEEKKNRPLVIYHANCRDGFCAAWVLWEKFGDKADYVPCAYGEDPPDVTGRKVFLVDFTFKRTGLLEMIEKAAFVTVLDHHKTAKEDLEGLVHPKTKIVFDMDRSGAGLTWDMTTIAEFENGGPCYDLPAPRNWIVNYIEDRDLWKWSLPDSRLVNYYLGVIPFDFETWSRVAKTCTPEQAKAYGDIIEQKVRQYCEEVTKNTVFGTLEFDREMQTHGIQKTPIINAPQVDISELLEFQMEKYKTNFSIGWFQRKDGLLQYSLRSKGDLDVSSIAKIFGGGGHKNAAGFQTEIPVHVYDE